MRKAGVLLHISSLPGEFGCGTFGKNAYRFADFLASSGFTIWQVLPFNIPHKDACPYSSVSTFAQNPLFIDPEILLEKGLITKSELDEIKEAYHTFGIDGVTTNPRHIMVYNSF